MEVRELTKEQKSAKHYTVSVDCPLYLGTVTKDYKQENWAQGSTLSYLGTSCKLLVRFTPLAA